MKINSILGAKIYRKYLELFEQKSFEYQLVSLDKNVMKINSILGAKIYRKYLQFFGQKST